MRNVVIVLAGCFLLVIVGCEKKMGPACVKLESCCKAASDALKCPSEVKGMEELSCENRLDEVKQELAAAKKPLPATCAP
jgi:hypothetical protein